MQWNREEEHLNIEPSIWWRRKEKSIIKIAKIAVHLHRVRVKTDKQLVYTLCIVKNDTLLGRCGQRDEHILQCFVESRSWRRAWCRGRPALERPSLWRPGCARDLQINHALWLGCNRTTCPVYSRQQWRFCWNARALQAGHILSLKSWKASSRSRCSWPPCRHCTARPCRLMSLERSSALTFPASEDTKRCRKWGETKHHRWPSAVTLPCARGKRLTWSFSRQRWGLCPEATCSWWSPAGRTSSPLRGRSAPFAAPSSQPVTARGKHRNGRRKEDGLPHANNCNALF